MAWRYSAFGLQIDSEISLTPLEPLPGPVGDAPDVTVRLGEVPTLVDRWVQVAADGSLVVDVADHARFSVSGGDTITVVPAPGADERTAALTLLSIGMCILLNQRGLLVLHAGAVVAGDSAIAFMGPSGIGKSSLTAALHRLGHQVITDDVLAVEVEAGRTPLALPAFSYLKLWPDAAARLRLDATELSPLTPTIEKLVAPLTALADPTPLRRLYVLEVGDGPDLTLEPLDGRARFETLSRHTHRRPLVGLLGREETHFRAVAMLAAGLPVTLVRRPATGCGPEMIAERLSAEAAKDAAMQHHPAGSSARARLVGAQVRR